MEAMDPDYRGIVTTPIPSSMKYPSQVVYGPMEKHLGEDVKKLRLHSTSEWKVVNGLLKQCKRVYVETKSDRNNAIRAICIQLHTLKEVTPEILRHQVAEYMVQEVLFFEPKMRVYLQWKKMSFNAYIIGVYNGNIWIDEFMLGAVGWMFNICVSIISPHFTDFWSIFHDGHDQPDIILIANGSDFGTEHDAITHFSATRGDEELWKCIGTDQGEKELEHYKKFVEGKKIGLDMKSINLTSRIIRQSQEMLHRINQVCFDLHNICLECDKVLNDLKDIDICDRDFKRVTAYYKEDEEESATSTSMPVPKRRLEIFPSEARGIPMVRIRDPRKSNVGQQILQKVIDDVNVSNIQVGEIITSTSGNTSCISQGYSSAQLTRERGQRASSREIVSQRNISEDRASSRCSIRNETTHEKSSRDFSSGSKKELPSVHQQIITNQRRRCRIKVPGGKAPPLTSTNPELPSLGQYEKMISTPEKNPKQHKHVYRSSIPRKEIVSNECEEGEIIDEDEQEQYTLNDEQNIDDDDEQEMTVNDPVNIQLCDDEEQIVISDDNYDITNDVTIPQELNIITEEDVLDTLPGNNSPAIHYSNIEDVLEVLDSDENKRNEVPTNIQQEAELNSSLEQEIDNVMTDLDIVKKNDDEICDVLIDATDLNVLHEEEVVAGTVSRGTDNSSSEPEEEHEKRVNVITVQPVAYYDELFPHVTTSSETVTQAQTSNETVQDSILMGIKTEMDDITARITSENVPVVKSEYEIVKEKIAL